jgi:hypothetical protein
MHSPLRAPLSSPPPVSLEPLSLDEGDDVLAALPPVPASLVTPVAVAADSPVTTPRGTKSTKPFCTPRSRPCAAPDSRNHDDEEAAKVSRCISILELSSQPPLSERHFAMCLECAH